VVYGHFSGRGYDFARAFGRGVTIALVSGALQPLWDKSVGRALRGLVKELYEPLSGFFAKKVGIRQELRAKRGGPR